MIKSKHEGIDIKQKNFHTIIFEKFHINIVNGGVIW